MEVINDYLNAFTKSVVLLHPASATELTIDENLKIALGDKNFFQQELKVLDAEGNDTGTTELRYITFNANPSDEELDKMNDAVVAGAKFMSLDAVKAILVQAPEE